MKVFATLSYLDFMPKGYIPNKAFLKFKAEHSNCIILEEKQGKYIVKLKALKLEDSDIEKMKEEANKK